MASLFMLVFCFVMSLPSESGEILKLKNEQIALPETIDASSLAILSKQKLRQVRRHRALTCTVLRPSEDDHDLWASCFPLDSSDPEDVQSEVHQLSSLLLR